MIVLQIQIKNLNLKFGLNVTRKRLIKICVTMLTISRFCRNNILLYDINYLTCAINFRNIFKCMIEWRQTLFVRILKMSDCGCGCDCLICDLTFLFIRFFFEKCLEKQPSTSAIFVIRCYLGLVFDAIEYGILTATADNIDYDRFEDIFIVYVLFAVFILLSFLCTLEVFIFICALFFKCISLSVAISIFTTTLEFEWDSIETKFTTIDSAGDFFTALLIFVSFADICLNIIALFLKIMYFCILMFDSKKCCDKFWNVICKSAWQVGVDNDDLIK